MDQLTHDSSAMSDARNIVSIGHEHHDSSLEANRLWSVVRENSTNFNAWTSLIQETEKLNNLTKIREVYDSFLAVFPLCYGYWKKYADHEARLGSVDMVVEVYEQAVQAVTYSVDIWTHFCVFAMAMYEDPNDIRRLFERGISYVGTDYLSHLLWDKYIEFEYSQQEWSRLAHIYTRILQIPIQQLDRYYNSFKQLATTRPLIELLSVEENAVVVAATAAASVEVGGEGGGGTSNGEDSPKHEGEALSKAEGLEKYLVVAEAMYKKAKAIAKKIEGFESAIRRPYFHVKALDDRQLCNWRHYLDFVEKEGDFAQTVKLYERCLIACANYPEYWIRYVQCMEAEGGIEIANDALARATQTFLKKWPGIHIFSARFKEQTGDMSGARAEYRLLSTELAPGLLECIVKHANMEQRQGNIEMASAIYETAIETEKGKEGSQSLPFLFIQYSRFLDLVTTNIDRAREVLVRAVQHLPLSKSLLEALIHFESIHTSSKQIDYLDSLVEKATSPKPDSTQGLSVADREEISSIFLEFVDLFGDIHTIKKAEMRHKQLFSPYRSFGGSKKHPYTDTNASDRVKASKPSMASSLASPAVADPPYVSPSNGAKVAKPNTLASPPETDPLHASISDRTEVAKPNTVAPAQAGPRATTSDMREVAKANIVAPPLFPLQSGPCQSASDGTKVAKPNTVAPPAQASPPCANVSDMTPVYESSTMASPSLPAQANPPYPSASDRAKTVTLNTVAAPAVATQAAPPYAGASVRAKVTKPNMAAPPAQASPPYANVSDTAQVYNPSTVASPPYTAQANPPCSSASDRAKTVTVNMVAGPAIAPQAATPYAGASVRAIATKPNAVAPPASPAPDGPPYTDGQSQWCPGYGPPGYAQQPQNWQQLQPQQVLQVQPQWWNPGYAQQGGYGAYEGGYDNHEAPHLQLSLSRQELQLSQQQQPHLPNHQGYEGYRQGYSQQVVILNQNEGYTQQALPQQNYGQPATAYVLPPQQASSQQNSGHPAPAYTSPQQQAPGQPGYYAGYH